MRIKIIHARVVTQQIETDCTVYLEGGKICAVGGDLPFDTVLDAAGAYLAPGFIDMHTHRGGGHDFMDGGIAPILEAAKMHLRHGTTSLLATTLSSSLDDLSAALGDIGAAMQASGRLPHILGAHLEGPYFSQAQCGAQDPRYITPPIPSEYEQMLKTFPGVIRRWSFAPKLPGAQQFCRRLLECGVIPAIGHTDAVYKDIRQIVDCGCRLVTHFYSGMSGLTRRGGFRTLGAIESTYLFDELCAEIIADGKHLPPELLRLIVKGKGVENLCLVTDSMRGAGMPEGPTLLGSLRDGVPCLIEEGVAKMPDHTSFAGSVATFDRLIRTMRDFAGVSLPDCIRMASTNPARILGLPHKGRIAPGFDADLVLFDDNIRVQAVCIGGGPDTAIYDWR